MESFLMLGSIGSEMAQMASETATEFGLNWPHFIAQVISFSIVAFLLHRFAYKPILRTLEDRRQRIAESLTNAEKVKEELAKAETAREEIMVNANQQANELIEEARQVAARLQEKESQKAIATAEQIVAKARAAAEADHARMLTELRQEVGRLVVQTTTQVAGKVLTSDDQRRLVEEANKELAA